MGLDAAVYRNIITINLGEAKGAARADPLTGEVYFDDPEIESRFPKDSLIAAQVRLGNISAIDALRDEVERILGPESLITKFVLYSGSHCGDAIPLNALPGLSEEIDSLRDSRRASQILDGFLEQMEALILKARLENNPIVFV